MSTGTLVILIVLGVALLFVGFIVLRRYLVAKKIDGDAVANEVQDCANVAEAFATAITPFLPANIAAIITKLAVSAFAAVKMGERLWQASAIPEDQRKTMAISLIQYDLQKAGITVDDNVNKWIDVVVDLMCRFLKKSHLDPITMIPGAVADPAQTIATPIAPVIGTLNPTATDGTPTGAAQAAEIKQDTALAHESSTAAPNTAGMM